jgi:hypothetical protein
MIATARTAQATSASAAAAQQEHRRPDAAAEPRQFVGLVTPNKTPKHHIVWSNVRITNFHRCTHATAARRRTDLISTIASYMDDAQVSRGRIVMDTPCYAEICHALGKLQAHGTIDIDGESCPPSAAAAPQHRILVNYLVARNVGLELFVDSANAHDAFHIGSWTTPAPDCPSWSRRRRPAAPRWAINRPPCLRRWDLALSTGWAARVVWRTRHLLAGACATLHHRSIVRLVYGHFRPLLAEWAGSGYSCRRQKRRR